MLTIWYPEVARIFIRLGMIKYPFEFDILIIITIIMVYNGPVF